ncbi:unnamed protein product [Dovyalis caffra]|uniref:Uncharacterized protein n=1 Tax=Dovyalis caffra TaxID=77055 RepID=A0AAV1SHK0_9ROSI|nr:unnamed protein product [Dovyalis caffra]
MSFVRAPPHDGTASATSVKVSGPNLRDASAADRFAGENGPQFIVQESCGAATFSNMGPL